MSISQLERKLVDYVPGMWRSVPSFIRRHSHLAIASHLDSTWLDRPRRVSLADAPISMEVLPHDVIGRGIFLYGIWEVPTTRLLEALLRPGMGFIDVGANIGYHSLLAASLVGAAGVVHSFEPDDAIRARLQRNLEMNGFGQVVVHREALTRHSGTVALYRSADPANAGIASTIPGATSEGFRKEQSATLVPALTLDDFMSESCRQRIDLIKIDVEGAELDVLQGADGILSQPRAPQVLFEISPTLDPTNGRAIDTLGPVARKLQHLGYTVRQLHYSWRTGVELRPVSPRFAFSVNHFLAFKQAPAEMPVKVL